MIGAAESRWQKPAFEIDSVAQVLKTAAMVGKDWRRTVVVPQVAPRLRQSMVKDLGSSGKLVSFGRVAFPHIAKRVRAFRVVVSVKTSLGPTAIEVELVALGVGRNELNLNVSGPKKATSSLTRFAKRTAGCS